MANHKMSRHDRLFLLSLIPFACIAIAAFIFLFEALVYVSIPIFKKEGISFITSSTWAPNENNPNASFYGIASALFGTFVTSAIALVIALPIALSATIFFNEVLPASIRGLLSSIIDLAAGIPTIIYGLWGLTILAPFLKIHVMQPLYTYLGFIPLFSCQPLTGYTLFTAGVVLGIMIIPYIFALVNEAYMSIPVKYREALASMGARCYESSRILLSMIKPAIIGASLLGLGRACSETVAVALVVGNAPSISSCLFTPGYTISSLIATQFANAGLYKYMMNALYGAGLILLIIGLTLTFLGIITVNKTRYLLYA